jgi:hypothetical protein
MTKNLMNLMTTGELGQILAREQAYETQLEKAGRPTSEQHRLVATIRMELTERLGVSI